MHTYPQQSHVCSLRSRNAYHWLEADAVVVVQFQWPHLCRSAVYYHSTGTVNPSFCFLHHFREMILDLICWSVQVTNWITKSMKNRPLKGLRDHKRIWFQWYGSSCFKCSLLKIKCHQFWFCFCTNLRIFL